MEMKPWQRNIPIETLKEVESFYKHYNAYAFSRFTQMNKQSVANGLAEETLVVERNRNNRIIYAYDCYSPKVKTAIESLGNIVAYKQPGDFILSRVAYEPGYSFNIYSEEMVMFLKEVNMIKWAPMLIYIWEEDNMLKSGLHDIGFTKLCTQFKSTAEVVGLYVNNAFRITREIKEVPKVDRAGLTQISFARPFLDVAISMGNKLNGLDLNFTNHYSNYNKDDAWSAISLRGFSEDIQMVEKPSAMTGKHKANYEGKTYTLQNTWLYKEFATELETIISCLNNPEVERIRFMKLTPGGGELTRHSDQVDKDIGTADGEIMRFHIPIITNPNVEFSVWNWEGQKQTENMKQGSLWCLDLRKPHTVINNGDSDRIHLVIDILCDDKIRKLIDGTHKL